jgi:hypothetical protein
MGDGICIALRWLIYLYLYLWIEEGRRWLYFVLRALYIPDLVSYESIELLNHLSGFRVFIERDVEWDGMVINTSQVT